MSKHLTSCVYVIGRSGHGPVKIGVSECPEVRLLALQSCSPHQLLILAQFVGGKETEEKVHELFAQERLRGEWFKRSPRIKTFIDMINCNAGLAAATARIASAICQPQRAKNEPSR